MTSHPGRRLRTTAPGSARRSEATLTLLILAGALALVSMAASIANVALPALSEAFNAHPSTVQWVVIAYLLTTTVAAVAAGRLGDMFGRRRLLLAGLALFTFSAALCAAAPSLSALLAARAAQGLGAAVLMALIPPLVRTSVGESRLGAAMGLLGTASAVGTALGPILGGVLLAAVGWRAIFVVTAGLGCAALLLARRHSFPEHGSASFARRRFDSLGALLLGFSITAVALAMTAGKDGFSGMNAALAAAATICGGAFAWWQQRAPSPLIRLGMLAHRGLGDGLAMNLLVSAVMMGTLVIGPFYLTETLGLSIWQAGLVLAAGPVISALSGAPAGLAVDRFGAARMIRIGIVQMAFGAAALAFAPNLIGLIGYLGAIAVLTPGYQLFLAANNTAALRAAPDAEQGGVGGLLSLSRNLGFVAGAAGLGAIFTSISQSAGADARKASEAAMETAFGVATALLLGAFVVAARLRTSSQQAS